MYIMRIFRVNRCDLLAVTKNHDDELYRFFFDRRHLAQLLRLISVYFHLSPTTPENFTFDIWPLAGCFRYADANSWWRTSNERKVVIDVM